MYRTHHCGELRIDHAGKTVTLSGWVQRVRNMGGMTFIDLRDRYGITQLFFSQEENPGLTGQAQKAGRESVVQATGTVRGRSSKNPKLPTGDIEILVDALETLSKADTPPFTIEDVSDGGEELRMKYRYLDLRRQPLQRALQLRHKMAQEVRVYLNKKDFMEIETPYLIKSTPEGARDFVVPSRLHGGEFYALPQSPQVFKQLLMLSGYDRYYQVVKCFRDEDFRADRQPEFTQVDVEMAFVHQDDVLDEMEGLARHLFEHVAGYTHKGAFPRMTYHEAIKNYGTDRPDLRFGMPLHEIKALAAGKNFKVFDAAEYVGGITAKAAAGYSRKQLDKLTDFVKKPQIGAKGLVHVKYNEDGSFKSSVDKFFGADDFRAWAEKMDAHPGDLMLILAGGTGATRSALGELRLEMGRQLGLVDAHAYAPLWVVDFPLVEYDEENGRYAAMHHPFTAPKPEHAHMLDTDPGKVNANAYDLVINGVEIGGGSIRIHDADMQQRMFAALGMTEAEAREKFGFLMDAFRYGAPPHGGCAFGLDRWVALFGGLPSIRDVIAFPKNNAGRDLMIQAPAGIAAGQLKELHLALQKTEEGH